MGLADKSIIQRRLGSASVFNWRTMKPRQVNQTPSFFVCLPVSMTQCTLFVSRNFHQQIFTHHSPALPPKTGPRQITAKSRKLSKTFWWFSTFFYSQTASFLLTFRQQHFSFHFDWAWESLLMRVEFRERCILRHIDWIYWMCFLDYFSDLLPTRNDNLTNPLSLFCCRINRVFDVSVMSLAVLSIVASIDANFKSGLLSKAWKNTANHI
jgi:hypothetical protein